MRLTVLLLLIVCCQTPSTGQENSVTQRIENYKYRIKGESKRLKLYDYNDQTRKYELDEVVNVNLSFRLEPWIDWDGNFSEEYIGSVNSDSYFYNPSGVHYSLIRQYGEVFLDTGGWNNGGWNNRPPFAGDTAFRLVSIFDDGYELGQEPGSALYSRIEISKVRYFDVDGPMRERVPDMSRFTDYISRIDVFEVTYVLKNRLLEFYIFQDTSVTNAENQKREVLEFRKIMNIQPPEKSSSVQLTTDANNQHSLVGKFGDINQRFLFDTGASITTVPKAYLGLFIENTLVRSTSKKINLTNASGNSEIYPVYLADIEIGAQIFKNSEIVFTNGKSLLGMNIISQMSNWQIVSKGSEYFLNFD